MNKNPAWDKDAWILRAVDAGVIRVERDGRILRPGDYFLREIQLSTHKKTGRVYFQLSFEGLTKSVLVNRAVGLVYLPNPDNLPQVNHKDGVKANNHVDNLEWSSKADNEKHAFANGLKSNRGTANGNSKLTPADVQKIRQAPADTLIELAQNLSISMKTLRDVRERRTWRHL